MRLPEYARYYVSLVDGSDGYLDQVMYALKDFERVVGEIQVKELSGEKINQYLRDTKGRLSPKTRSNRLGYLKTLLKHAQTNPVLEDRPSCRDPIGQVKVPERIVESWTVEEVQQLLAYIETMRGRYRNGFDKRLYWRSYVLAGWDLGLRGCDLRSLERDWVPSSGRLTIVQAKTGRVVVGQLRQPALNAIEDFQHDGRLIWPVWCRMCSWRKTARKVVRNAGVKGSIGWLRSSAATATEVESPGTGHLFLGHSNRETFVRHYYDRSQAASIPLPPPIVV